MGKREKASVTFPQRGKLGVTGNDLAALAYVRTKYSYSREVEVLRYALRQQYLSDQYARDLDNGRYHDGWVFRKVLADQILPSVKEIAKAKGIRSRETGVLCGGMEECQYFFCLLTMDDIGHIKEVKRHWGLRWHAEACRLALRVQAVIEGYEPRGGW